MWYPGANITCCARLYVDLKKKMFFKRDYYYRKLRVLTVERACKGLAWRVRPRVGPGGWVAVVLAAVASSCR